MSYKDLLVHVDTSKHCKARLEFAVSQAKTLDAHLTGLYVMPHRDMSPLLADQFPPGQLEEMRAQVALERDRAKDLFAEITKPLGAKAEWCETAGDAERILPLEARRADLAILGQADPDEVKRGVSIDLPEQIAISTGRPVLLLPYAGRFESVGERVLIAWNGSPQAARTVNDALPFLKGAHRVIVATVAHKDGSRGDGGVPIESVVRHLARHGVKAEAHPLPAADISVSDVLLSTAADEDIDLIVMGVYGHSRLRELVMGGVSRELFERMTVPVLMAH
jgi:nucleotide-binding universal stress UspA family protein